MSYLFCPHSLTSPNLFLFLVADTRLHLAVSVGPSVRWSDTLLNCHWFLHYCSCPTVRDWIAMYLALFGFMPLLCTFFFPLLFPFHSSFPFFFPLSSAYKVASCLGAMLPCSRTLSYPVHICMCVQCHVLVCDSVHACVCAWACARLV